MEREKHVVTLQCVLVLYTPDLRRTSPETSQSSLLPWNLDPQMLDRLSNISRDNLTEDQKISELEESEVET